MRTSDPAATALRVDELPALAGLSDSPEAPSAVSATEAPLLNLSSGAVYARVPSERARWLALVTDEASTAEPALPEGEAEAKPACDAAPLAPLALPLEMAAPAILDTPAALVSLLQAAGEYRRVVDLVWTAHELGAVRLPAALADRIERVRQAWPDVLSPLPIAVQRV